MMVRLIWLQCMTVAATIWQFFSSPEMAMGPTANTKTGLHQESGLGQSQTLNNW